MLGQRATEEMARDAESEAAKVRSGLIDPRDVALRKHESRPLVGHAADWHADLLGRGATAQHADLSRNRALRLIGLARMDRLPDLSPSGVVSALATVRDEGASLQSLHHYVRAIKGFSRWLWRDGRVREDALAHLTGSNAKTNRRRERRALSPDEASRLIEAAERGPVVLTMTGTDRAMLYRLALGTGFRANELRSLAPESFRLDDDRPTVKVNAAYSKRRRDDAQPIRVELAEALRPWVASKAPGTPVFGDLTKLTALMLRVDLEAAGVAYRDAAGRVADFHGLRHTYISTLAMSTAPVKVVQSLARHSTPTPTPGVYAHLGLDDQADALKALAITGGRGVGKDASLDQLVSNRFAHHLPTTGDVPGRLGADADAVEDVGTAPYPLPSMTPQTLIPSGLDVDCRGLSQADGSGGGGIRTHGGCDASTVFKTVDGPPESPENHSCFPHIDDPLAHHLPTDTRQTGPDLAEVVEAWDRLPEPTRQATLKLVREGRPG